MKREVILIFRTSSMLPFRGRKLTNTLNQSISLRLKTEDGRNVIGLIFRLKRFYPPLIVFIPVSISSLANRAACWTV